MNLIPFDQFLSSLARISRWHFEVWDADKAVFSSNGDPPQMEVAQDIRELSIKAINSGRLQRVRHRDNCHLFGLPIKNNGKVVGSLIACTPISGTAFDPMDIPNLNSSSAHEMENFLTDLLGLMQDRWATENELEEVTEELSLRFEDIYLYSNIAPRIQSLRVSSSMLNDLVGELLEAMHTELAFARLPKRREFDTLVTKKEFGNQIPQPDAFVDALIEAIPADAPTLRDHYFLVADSRQTPFFKALHPVSFRFLAVKIQHNDNFYGWLGLVSLNTKDIFRRSELRLMGSIAEQLSLVIANTDMYEDLEGFVINVVKSLVYAIEAKDEYTRGHSERVSRYALLVGTRLGLNEKQKKVLHWAALLHDIGKIGVPETILLKTRALNDAEYGLIKSHSEKGCEILQPLEQLSASIPGIRHHHERFDGQGYPAGLKGKDIPLLGRIIAVADTFDALTSSRSYRPGKTVKEALEIIDSVAGPQLDPDLVDVFKDVLREDFEEVHLLVNRGDSRGA